MSGLGWKLTLPPAVAGLVEAHLGLAAGVSDAVILPLVAGTAAAIACVMLAIDTGLRRFRGPRRAQIDEALAFLRDRLEADREAAERNRRVGEALTLLAAEPELRSIEAQLREAAMAVERFDAIAEALPAWQTALSRWYAVVANVAPTILPQSDAVSDEDLRRARARLPFNKNLSSADLKAALGYLAQSNIWEDTQNALSTHRTTVIAAIVD